METIFRDLTVDVQLLSLISGLLIPLLVGILTKLNASSGVKAIGNVFFSVVTGLVAGALTTGGVIGGESIYLAVQTFVISTATHYGVWKPTGVTATVQGATAGFGAGGSGDGERGDVSLYMVAAVLVIIVCVIWLVRAL